MAHSDAGEGKWRGKWRMEWVASTLHTTSEHGVPSITTAGAHTSAASSQLNWLSRRLEWTRPFRRKKKSGFCACIITFQTQSTWGKIARETSGTSRFCLPNCRLGSRYPELLSTGHLGRVILGPLVCLHSRECWDGSKYSSYYWMLPIQLLRLIIHHNVAEHCGYIRQTPIAGVSCSHFGTVRLKFNFKLYFGEPLGQRALNVKTVSGR
jgi:hypothetical protein